MKIKMGGRWFWVEGKNVHYEAIRPGPEGWQKARGMEVSPKSQTYEKVMEAVAKAKAGEPK